MFYYCDEYLTAPTVSLGLPKQFVILSARAFMSAMTVSDPIDHSGDIEVFRATSG